MRCNLSPSSATSHRTLSGLAIAALLAVAARAPAGELAISYVSEGTQGGETFAICGDGFDAEKLEVFRWVPPQAAKDDWARQEYQQASLERFLAGKAAAPARPPEGKPSQKLEILSRTANTLAARQPIAGGSTVQPTVLWVKTPKALAGPWVANRPILWWAAPEFPAPGDCVRVFGRNLVCIYGPGRAAFLRAGDGKLLPLEWGLHYSPVYDNRLTPLYEFEFRLPADVLPGEYQLYLHAGGGGDLGWSDPLPITLRPRLPLPSGLLKAADFGAVPDDATDDTAAIQKAMDAMAAAGGGVVQLAPGSFLLCRTLLVPPTVRLRGAGLGVTVLTTADEAALAQDFPAEALQGEARDYLKGLHGIAPLVALRDRCGLERLTVRGGQNTICVFLGGGNRLRRDLSVCDVEMVNRHPVWLPRGEYRHDGNVLALTGPMHGLRLTNCRLEGASCLVGMPGGLSRAVIEGNTFRSYPPGRSDCVGIRDISECLIENNYYLEAKRGFVIQNHGKHTKIYHNVLARNVQEHTSRGGNAGETELWETLGTQVRDTVRTGGPETITAEKMHFEADQLSGYYCLIAAGRGLGQYRIVTGNTADTIRVDRPWSLIPGPGARFVVTRGSLENLSLNNSHRNGEAAVQLWGDCVGNVFSGHIMDDTEGMALWGADFREAPGGPGEVALCWFNDIRQCRFEHGAGLSLRPSRKPDPEFDDAGAIVFGNTIRECTFGNGPRLPRQNQWHPYWENWDREKPVRKYDRPGQEAAIRLAAQLRYLGDPDEPAWNTLQPAITLNVIERNFVQGWPVGIYESRSARGNVLGVNTIAGAKEAVVRTGEEKPAP